MKKVLLFVLALSLFPALASAHTQEQRQLAKINAKQALKFPQECNIEESVIARAKKVYNQNPNNFVAVYNYAVTLSAGDCGDTSPWIPEEHVELAKKLFTKALKLKPTSPSCYAGLGYLTMYKSGLAEALLVGNNSMDDTLFPRTVKAHQQEAEQALAYYEKALELNFTGSFLESMKYDIKDLKKALEQIKTDHTRKAVKGKVSKKR